MLQKGLVHATIILFVVILWNMVKMILVSSFPVMNQIQLLSCFVKLRRNRALLRKGFKCQNKCQMFVYSGHALSYTSQFTGMPLKVKETNISNEHNRLENPNWQEADQLAIYKHDRGVELGSTEKQLQISGQSGTWTRDLRISTPAP